MWEHNITSTKKKQKNNSTYKYDEWVKEAKEGNEQKEMKELHNELIRKK